MAGVVYTSIANEPPHVRGAPRRKPGRHQPTPRQQHICIRGARSLPPPPPPTSPHRRRRSARGGRERDVGQLIIAGGWPRAGRPRRPARTLLTVKKGRRAQSRTSVNKGGARCRNARSAVTVQQRVIIIGPREGGREGGREGRVSRRFPVSEISAAQPLVEPRELLSAAGGRMGGGKRASGPPPPEPGKYSRPTEHFAPANFARSRLATPGPRRHRRGEELVPLMFVPQRSIMHLIALELLRERSIDHCLTSETATVLT